MRDASIIFSFEGCEHGGDPAKWDAEKEQWICPVHNSSDCVTTYQNIGLLDKLAGGRPPDARKDWPSEEQIAKHQKRLKDHQIYHVWEHWITQQLTFAQWEEMTDRLGEVLEDMGIEEMANGGPIPEVDS